MHINIHYPNIIPEIDPLEPLSCIRMEAKHREGKQIAHLSASRINLPYSIAKRHQQNFAVDYSGWKRFIIENIIFIRPDC